MEQRVQIMNRVLYISFSCSQIHYENTVWTITTMSVIDQGGDGPYQKVAQWNSSAQNNRCPQANQLIAAIPLEWKDFSANVAVLNAGVTCP